MFCTNCGTKNNEGSAFCANCGALIKQTGSNNASSAAPTPPPVSPQSSQHTPSTYHPASDWFDANRKVRGKNFLFVVGIMSIIGGGMNIIGSITSLQLLARTGLDGLRATFAFALFAGAYQLIMGTAGVRFCKVVEKAPMLLTMGIVALVIPIVSLINTIAVSGVAFGFVGIVGFVLPVLFIIGAKMNMST